jgi:GTP pyrophosphokinase
MPQLLPDDPIVAFVLHKTRGVMVHRLDCINHSNLTSERRERLMPAQWGNVDQQPFAADIEVTAMDRRVCCVMCPRRYRERINVTAVSIGPRARQFGLNTFHG